MDESNRQIIDFYKKRIEPFMAIFIAALLITGLVLLWQDNQLKKEIAENCGFEKENYICYCEQKIVQEQMEIRSNKEPNLEQLNITNPEK